MSNNFENLKESTKRCLACGARLHMMRLGGWSGAPEVLRCVVNSCPLSYTQCQFRRKPGALKWIRV